MQNKSKINQFILQFCTSLVYKFSYRIKNISDEIKNLTTPGSLFCSYKRKIT